MNPPSYDSVRLEPETPTKTVIETHLQRIATNVDLICLEPRTLKNQMLESSQKLYEWQFDRRLYFELTEADIQRLKNESL